MILGNLCVAPPPHMMPNLISGCENFASSLDIIMSHIINISHPPPDATPCTAATIGFFIFSIFSQISGNFGLLANSLISAPAEKFSSPVNIIHFILGLLSACCNTKTNSSDNSLFNALYCLDLFS